MGKLVCRLRERFLGYERAHRWKSVWTSTTRERAGTTLVCLRCRENGWRI